jgi:dihydroflavonol-4-reductase
MIAITGANGLLGSFIIRKLLETNQPFIAIKRKDSDTSLLDDIVDKITWRDAAVEDFTSLSEAFENVTHVIHTAAVVSFNPRESELILKVNIEGTQNVVNACLNAGVKRMIHISSVAALGRQKNQTVITEENKWIDSALNSTYAYSKYQAELEVFRGQEEGLSTLIVNPSVILAPSDWTKSSSQLFKYVWTQKFFYINGSLNYVDVRDVSSIVCKLLHSKIESERFILNGGSISFKEFFDRIGNQFKKRAPFLKLNKTFLTVIAFLESLRSVLVRSKPLITPETARLANTRFLYDNAKIKKTLNFEFQTIDSTIQWCCSYYMQKINNKK